MHAPLAPHRLHSRCFVCAWVACQHQGCYFVVCWYDDIKQLVCWKCRDLDFQLSCHYSISRTVGHGRRSIRSLRTSTFPQPLDSFPAEELCNVKAFRFAIDATQSDGHKSTFTRACGASPQRQQHGCGRQNSPQGYIFKYMWREITSGAQSIGRRHRKKNVIKTCAEYTIATFCTNKRYVCVPLHTTRHGQRACDMCRIWCVV